MERHPTDYVELLFGLAFLATGAGFIVRQTTNRDFDPSWIAAIALVAVGCAFLAVTVVNRPRAGAGEAPLERVVTPGEPSETSETRAPGEESQTE
jgi:4-amino-4-deoxy-L-arabinose transferase-like glycosyltransferase